MILGISIQRFKRCIVYTNTDNNLPVYNNTINSKTSIETETATFTTLNIPNNALNKYKISNLNSSLNSLSNNKQNNITLTAGTNVTIDKQNDTRTINSTGGSNLTGTRYIIL